MFTLQMKRSVRMIAAATAVGLLLTGVSLTMGQASAAPAVPDRPEGPCDIYEKNDLPCWSLHSSTRALKASYDGPLYQVRRHSDGKLKDIGIVAPSAGDAGGYADAAAQDAFCLDTYCEIERVYDQSGYGNDIYGNPRGGLSAYQLGGNDAFVQADWAPVSLNGHKVYGLYVTHGMGLRNDDPTYVVRDDMPASDYWVIDGRHFGSGCCFGYGNGEPDSRDNGNGTMEAMAFGSSRSWHFGAGPGPWAQTDQENNLIGCIGTGDWHAPAGFPDGYTTEYGLGLTGYNARFCGYMPPVTWRWFAGFGDFGSKGDIVNGTPMDDGYWANRGANLDTDYFMTYWEGYRLNKGYNPMRKQGAIYFGTGGDNSISAWGTMYEGGLAHKKSTEAIDKVILANIKAAKYAEAPALLEPVGKEGASGNLMTFAPGTKQQATLSWTNMTGSRAAVVLSIASNGAYGVSPAAKTFLAGVAAGETVSQVFTITGGAIENNADLVGTVDFLPAIDDAATQTDTWLMHARNTAAIKINEYSIQTSGNTTNSFIELYNAGATAVDISGWTLTETPDFQVAFSDIVVPASTTIAPGGTYVFGLSTSGIGAPTQIGATNVKVRSVTGLAAGQQVQIGTGDNAEFATIQTVGTARTAHAANTVVFMPLPPSCDPINCSAPEQMNRPNTKYEAGSTNLPITTASGFTAGGQVLVGYGDTQEILTVADDGVGTTGLQWYFAPALNWGQVSSQPDTLGKWNDYPMTNPAGTTFLKVQNNATSGNPANITAGFYAGMDLRLDVDDRMEWVKVKSVGTSFYNGTGLELEEPTKFDHYNGMPIAARGTGITFTTPTEYDHWSSEPILPLGTGVTFEAPLTKAHAMDEVIQVVNATGDPAPLTNAGFTGTPDQWYGGPSFHTTNGALLLKTAKGNVVDSLNYGQTRLPWLAEGFQRLSPGGPCVAPVPGSGVSAGRFPDGADRDSNCKDFVGGPRTPGAASSVTVPTGTVVSLQFAKDPTQYVIHNDRELQWGTVTSDLDKMNASWIAVPALSGAAGCVSFMSYNEPNMYIRQNNNIEMLWMTDNSSSFNTAASFCPVKTVGTSSPTVDIMSGPSSDIRLRSAGTNTRYFRALYNLYDEHGLFQAADGVTALPTAGDTPMNWAEDIVWNVVEGFALDVDKAALQALVDKVNALNPGHYINWYAQVSGVLADAQAVLDTFGGPSPAAIQAAYDALEAALDGLIPIMSQVVLTNPVISGDAMVGHTLTVSANPFPTDATLSYQWYISNTSPCDINGVAIAGATGSTYLVQATDASNYICAKVTASLDGVMAPASKFSNEVSVQVPIAVQKAILSGVNAVGGTVTIDLAYTPTDSTYTVEWYRNGTELIAGANTLAYTITQADSGADLVAKITVSKAGYDSLTVFTNTIKVQGNPPPDGKVILTPVGPVTPGQAVTLSANVTPAGAFTLAEWYVGGSVVMISTNAFDGSVYTPTAADAGKTIVVKLTVYVPSFSPLVLFSNAVDVI